MHGRSMTYGDGFGCVALLWTGRKCEVVDRSVDLHWLWRWREDFWRRQR